MYSNLQKHTASERFWRRVAAPVLGVFSVVTILFFAAIIFAALDSDSISVERQGREVSQALSDSLDELARSQEVGAIWDYTVQEMRKPIPDWKWVDDNIGLWLHRLFKHDQVFILNAKDEPIYATSSGRRRPMHSFPSADPSVRRLIERVRGRTTEAANVHERLPRTLHPQATVRTGPHAIHATDIVMIGKRPALASVMRIVPLTDKISRNPVGREPLLVNVRFVDGSLLKELESTNLISAPRFSLSPSTSAGERALAITSTRGDRIGYLIWRPELPGEAMLALILPLAAGSLLLLGLMMALLSYRVLRLMRTDDCNLERLIKAHERLVASEASLLEHRDELEKIVAQRTAEVKKKNAKLSRLLQKERDTSATQRRFVAMVSHEFRTPLTIIDAAAQRLGRSKASPSTDYLAEKAVQIRGSVARMVELMESILALGRLETGVIDISKKPSSISDVVETSVSKRRDVSPSHRIHLSLSDIPDVYDLDAEAMDRVIGNLLSNAVKYAPGSPDIYVRGWSDQEGVHVSVRDTGIGMHEEDLPRLFEPYFRAQSATGIAGTGIGLNIVREIVELHGGAIKVVSEIGQGTNFTVHLPWQVDARVGREAA